MISETGAAVLSRAISTDAALRRVPQALIPLTDGDTGRSMVAELDDYNTVDEVAAYLKYSPKQIRDWLADGTLQGERWGRQWRITRAAVEKFIESRRAAPVPEADTTAATAARRRKNEGGET
jgi:excisionase family DNA binding protein